MREFENLFSKGTLCIEFNEGEASLVLGDEIIQIGFSLAAKRLPRSLQMACEKQMHQLLPSWDGQWTSLGDGRYVLAADAGITENVIAMDPKRVCAEVVKVRHNLRKLIAQRQFLMAFPRYWELLGFAMSRKTRERVFEPAYNDLLAQHAKAVEQRFNKPWTLRWLSFCFAVESIRLVFQCLRVRSCALLGYVALKCLPAGLKDAVREFWLSLLR